MPDIILHVTINDWRDVGYDANGHRIPYEDDRARRKAILDDLASRAKYEIETRALDELDVVATVQREEFDYDFR